MAVVTEPENISLNRLMKLEKTNGTLRELCAVQQQTIDSLRKPPITIATVARVFDDGTSMVKLPNMSTFVVAVSKQMQDVIKEGDTVGLDTQTLGLLCVYPSSLEPEVTSAEIMEKPDVTFTDIGGLENEIAKVREVIELPLKSPELFQEIGIDPPKGLLLVGPPGCGKTMIAKAVANETEATFLRLNAPKLAQKFIGDGPRLVREIFELAKEKAPSILFIDEIDSIGSTRTDNDVSGDREVQRVLMQLLVEMDGFDSLGKVMIIAATNRPDMLDEALIRPGRFDRIVNIEYPGVEERLDILKVITDEMSLSTNVDLNRLAVNSPGASGADLKAVCMEAGLSAIRDRRKKIEQKDFDLASKEILIYETEPREAGVMFA